MDGTSSVNYQKLKESHPLEVSEYATANGIDQESAFCWWIPYTLRRRDKTISAVKSRIARVSHNEYGIELPISVAHAYKIDTANGNHLWREAINKEMGNLKVAFDILNDGSKPPPDYIIQATI